MNAKSTVRTIAAAALLACGAAAFAAPAEQPATAAAASLTAGEVRKIDAGNRKITLRHEAIRNLDMPPMTMVFQVRDPALLEQLHVGDKVLFAAASDGGKLTVTQIQPAK